jgi:hypothetical protein
MTNIRACSKGMLLYPNVDYLVIILLSVVFTILI